MLYFVGTSIGTLADTSYRAVETLISSDVILVEDTRSFAPYYREIQDLFQLAPQKPQKIISYHDQNEFEKLPEVGNYLDSNLIVSIATESGMPIVSDPGSQLMQMVIKKGHAYTVIPGPTALTTAMVHAGVSSGTLFVGFLPKKASHVTSLFLKMSQSTLKPLHIVAYESPHRIQSTLSCIHEILPDAKITICRELTKKFEEIVRGTPAQLREHTFKGEITLVVELL